VINYLTNCIEKYLNRKKFEKHNKKFFASNKKKNYVLVEFNKWAYLHVIKSYVSKCLCNRHNAQLLAFESYTIISEKLFRGIFKKILRSLLIFFSMGTYGVYKSFGVKKFIYPNIKKKDYFNKEFVIKKIIKKTDSKEKFLNLVIDGVYIGDLMYDSYLKKYNLNTVEVKSNEFKLFLKEFLVLFFWWFNFIKTNKKKIKSFIIIHAVYSFGLPSRIASRFNIDSYLVSHKSIVKINQNNRYITNGVNKNLSFFNKLDKKNKKKIYSFSKEEINKITKGISKTGKNYKTKIRNIKIFNPTNKKKILVCCHHFNDAPHVYGKFFASDFVEWYKILDKISKKNDYLWLIKPHPENYDKDITFFKRFFFNKENFLILNKNFSNQEILKQNIDLALTCFGTINFEYPFLGTKVLNFSKNQPYKNFNFSYSPINIKQYENFITNKNNFKYSINKKEIYAFYYLIRLFLNVDYMYLNLHPKNDLDGYRLKKKFVKTNFYQKWILNFNTKKHKLISKNIDNFINSGDYFMNNLHLENSNQKNLNRKVFIDLTFSR